MSFNPVQVVFHVPPLGSNDARLRALLQALEAQLPGAKLTWRAESSGVPSSDDEERWMSGAGVRLVRLADRDRWLADQFQQGLDVLLYSGPPRPGVCVSVAPLTSVTVRSGQAVGTVVLWLPEDTLQGDVLAQLLAASGDALGAWCAAFTPLAAAGMLLQVQLVPPGRVSPGRQRLIESNPALEALPTLRPGLRALPAAEVPPSIGWINYWSADTARWLGFPDEARDGEWIARSIRTPSGGWVLRLTEQPFDVNRLDHVQALVRAYQRFNRIVSSS